MGEEERWECYGPETLGDRLANHGKRGGGDGWWETSHWWYIVYGCTWYMVYIYCIYIYIYLYFYTYRSLVYTYVAYNYNLQIYIYIFIIWSSLYIFLTCIQYSFSMAGYRLGSCWPGWILLQGTTGTLSQRQSTLGNHWGGMRRWSY